MNNSDLIERVRRYNFTHNVTHDRELQHLQDAQDLADLYEQQSKQIGGLVEALETAAKELNNAAIDMAVYEKELSGGTNREHYAAMSSIAEQALLQHKGDK